MSEADDTPHGRLSRQIAETIERHTTFRAAVRGSASGYYLVPTGQGVQLFYYAASDSNVSDAVRQELFVERLEAVLARAFGPRRVSRCDYGGRKGFEIAL